MATSNAVEQIRKDEGLLLKATTLKFKGMKDELSIGHGYNLKQSDAKEYLILSGIKPNDVEAVMTGKKEITKEQADSLLNIQLQQAQKDVKNLVKDFGKLPQTVKDVLINMSYQLGETRLKGFDKMIDAVNNRDWPQMKKEMLNSEWSKQTPTRAKRLATQISGVKVETKEPRGSIRKQMSATELYQKQQHDSRVTSIADIMSRQVLVSQMADALGESQAEPAIQSTDLDENNQPKATIDPSKSNKSGVDNA